MASRILVRQPHSPLVLELIGTCLGLGLWSFGTNIWANIEWTWTWAWQLKFNCEENVCWLGYQRLIFPVATSLHPTLFPWTQNLTFHQNVLCTAEAMLRLDGMMAEIFVRWEVINVWYCDVSNVSNVPLYSQEDLFNVFWSSVFTGQHYTDGQYETLQMMWNYHHIERIEMVDTSFFDWLNSKSLKCYIPSPPEWVGLLSTVHPPSVAVWGRCPEK